ncbi:MAG: L,D-transpeptidase family protein [Pseudomonadota bacterium]
MTARADLVVTRWNARFLGRQFVCSIGRGGIVPAETKREGDGATPAGRYRILGCFARMDRLWLNRLPIPVAPTTHRSIWSDDPADSRYNTGLVADNYPYSHEKLRRSDGLYDLLAVIDHNQPAVPGFGSAIFLHCWRRPRYPTAGCVAFARADLHWILSNWSKKSRVYIRL